VSGGRVPAYLFPSKIARASGYSRKAVLTLLRGADLIERHGRLALVSRSRLRERLPDLYEDVYELYVLDRGKT
jgi:hypothetical protein